LLLFFACLPADSDDDDEDGKQKVSGPSREDVYSAFHKGTNSSKKKKQASVVGWLWVVGLLGVWDIASYPHV
jgi:hypothetical protein